SSARSRTRSSSAPDQSATRVKSRPLRSSSTATMRADATGRRRCRDSPSRGLSLKRARVFAENVAQAGEAGEHAALDRPEWLIQALGELGLRVAAVVGELDRLALLGWQLAEGIADRLALRRQLGLVGGPGVQRLCVRLQRFRAAALFATDEVDCSPVDERQEPGARLRALGGEPA